MFLAIAVENCATTSFSFKKLEVEPRTFSETSKIFSTDSQMVVNRLSITVPGEIVYYKLIDSLDAVLIKYSNYDKINTILLYDLNNKKPLWQATGNFYVSFSDKNDLILRYRKTKKIYDITNGNFIRNVYWPNAWYTLYFWNSEALIFDPKNISFVNLRTGDIKWQRPGINWKGYIWGYGIGNWFYFTASGLHKINIKNGDGWDFEASTSHKAYAKYIVKEAALTFLLTLGGRTYIGSSQGPDLTHNICTKKPLVTKENVYFAARDKLFKLNKETGTLTWETALDKELGLMDIFKISNTEIALVSYGLKYVNYDLKLTSSPSLRLFNSRTGEKTGLFNFENCDMILDIKFKNNRFYVLTPQKFYILDPMLNLLFTYDISTENDYLGQFAQLGDTLLIQSYKKIYAFSDSGLTELWHKKLPPLVDVNNKPKWKFPYYLNVYLDNNSTIINRALFRPSESGYIGISLNGNNNIILKFPNIIIGKGILSIHHNKKRILHSQNNTLTIYSL